jgi:hypothetical protein
MSNGTMPAVKLPRSLFRLLAGVALAALLTSACSTSVSGEPTAESDQLSTRAAPHGSEGSRSSGSSGQGCRVRVSSTGSISSSGAGGRTVTINGRSAFSCGRGPLVGIEGFDDSGVTFSVENGPNATVTAGSTVTVSEYQISVTSVGSNGAEFEVEPT